jgi:hypothetical protein
MSEGSKPPKAPPVQVTQVKIVDVDIPFNSLVGLIFKCIPAVMVVVITAAFVWFMAVVAIDSFR